MATTEDMVGQYQDELIEFARENIKGNRRVHFPDHNPLIQAFDSERDGRLEALRSFEDKSRKLFDRSPQDAVDMNIEIDMFFDAESNQITGMCNFRHACLRAFQDTCQKAIETRNASLLDGLNLIYVRNQ